MSFARPYSAMIKPVLVALVVGALAFLGHADVSSHFALVDKDRMTRWSSVLSGATRAAIPVTMIEIDDDTLAALGGLDRAPRDVVADLVMLAASKKPLGVFVDLDTSRAGPRPEADQRLRDMVAAYPADAPVLALARRFIEAPAKEPATELKLAPMRSILDAEIQGHANIVSASSVTQRDADRVVRRWQLTQTVCAGKDGVTYPSPQLLAAAASDKALAADALTTYLAWQARRVCGKSSEAEPAWPRNADTTATIWFLTSGENEAESARTSNQNGEEAAVIRRVSARTLIGADGKVAPARSVADQLFAGRYVIVGSGHIDSFDTHVTSVGPMPGFAIVANAVATAPATLSAHRMSGFARSLVALAIFGATVFLALKLRAIAAGVAIGALLLGMLAILGRYLAPSTAVEIVFLAMSMTALFSILESLLEVVKEWRHGKGWRVLLKPSTKTPLEAVKR